jgi:hypothetical protein
MQEYQRFIEIFTPQCIEFCVSSTILAGERPEVIPVVHVLDGHNAHWHDIRIEQFFAKLDININGRVGLQGLAYHQSRILGKLRQQVIRQLSAPHRERGKLG